MKNILVWVDIPVTDLDRAMAFYAAILGEDVTNTEFPGFRFGLLPHAMTHTSGCLYPASDGENAPAQTGPLIYLNVEGRMKEAVEVARTAGGKVLQEAHQIGEHGHRAVILDSEGNRIALHALTV